MEQNMYWAEAWLRTTTTAWQPRLRRLLGHRQPANIISEQAVWIGVTATLGLAAAVAFTTGIGQILARELPMLEAQRVLARRQPHIQRSPPTSRTVDADLRARRRTVDVNGSVTGRTLPDGRLRLAEKHVGRWQTTAC